MKAVEPLLQVLAAGKVTAVDNRRGMGYHRPRAGIVNSRASLLDEEETIVLRGWVFKGHKGHGNLVIQTAAKRAMELVGQGLETRRERCSVS